jgi:hypothetical protein
VFFWAAVSDEIDRAIRVLPHPPAGPRGCSLRALRDEPDWRRILRVEKIEFRTGTAN